MIDGPWFITRAALEDFARLTGRATAPRAELEQQIAGAHLVRLQRDGSELWRGKKPLRLRFFVRTGAGAGGDAPQLVRVEADHAGRSQQRARQLVVWDGSASRELSITDEVYEPDEPRRVAYRLASGQWLTGYRGRARPNHVTDLTQLQNTPDWVRTLREQRPRRGGRNRQ